MKRKRVICILVAIIIVLALAALALFWTRNKHEVIGTVESVQPPICTQNIANPTCGDGIVTIKTENGAVKEYKYASDKSESGEFNVISLQKGTKVKMMVSQGKITSIELSE
jgi:flagellar basal body-associated protein FliL